MTLLDFYNSCPCSSKFRVLSSYNGKVLSYNFNPKKHIELGKREVCRYFADLQVSHTGTHCYAEPIVCCYVDGYPEASKSW